MSERVGGGNSAVLAALAALTVLISGCGAGSAGSEDELTVLAAASLTESFDELGERFNAEHPDVQVRFDYQGSSTLAEQIRQGRPADVFAAADTENMRKVSGADDTAGDPATFAKNRLVIAVPKGNPADVRSLADFARPERTTVICESEVPCGSATRTVTEAAGVRPQPDSEENDVKAVLRKVQTGEADAGLVYYSDAQSAADEVDTIEFPESAQAPNEYPVATLRNAENPELARAFTEFVRGPQGREVLERHGFSAP